MPFTYPWTETEPTDQTYVREVDDWFRRLANAVRERLGVEHHTAATETTPSIIGKHKPGSARILAGPAASVPAVDADAPGKLYAATDADAETLLRDTGSAWVDVLCKPRKHASTHDPVTGTDPVPNVLPLSEVVAAAAPNKVLRLDDNAALPASADKVDGCDAGTGPGDVLKLDTAGRTPFANSARLIVLRGHRVSSGMMGDKGIYIPLAAGAVVKLWGRMYQCAGMGSKVQLLVRAPGDILYPTYTTIYEHVLSPPVPVTWEFPAEPLMTYTAAEAQLMTFDMTWEGGTTNAPNASETLFLTIE